MEVGIDSFAAILPDPTTGRPPSATDRMADLLDEIEAADRVGLDVFGVGEHHRAEFLDSAPAVILAVTAAGSSTIRLTSAVTVLSVADAVRVFQEVWHGRFRPALTSQGVFPRPHQPRLPVRLGVGGTPQSFVHAGTLGLPLMVAIIGGSFQRFRSLVDLYIDGGRRAGHAPEQLAVGVHAMGFVGETTAQAKDAFFSGWAHLTTTVVVSVVGPRRRANSSRRCAALMAPF